ncbi:MAG: ATP-binding region, ATPase domain protein [Marmoricola sp.]|nr:ATP-binding region, ATPase domain protein [Marmoricola sp.]
MSPTIQALLFALLGAVLGGGAVLAFRVSERQLHDDVAPQPALPPGVAAVLSVLRSSALVVDASDTVLKASAPAISMGIVRGNEITERELADLVRQVRRDGQIRETELTMQRPGMPPRHVTARVAPLSSQLVLALIEDRTRERRVESIRRDFVANVSHELKTPVGAIKLLSDAVIDAADDPEAVQRFAGRMHTESERLSRLVQQIIELSRLQGDDPLDEPVAVEADKIIARAIDESATDAAARNIELVANGTHGLILLGNREQIAVAVSNLVANAVTYSPEGSSVVVAATAHEAAVDISITDRGIGIPAKELDRIFERFYRVDPARHRSTGGTGLGLSVVKHVAASHGGEVRVWSVEGQGSTFTLTLPRKPGPLPGSGPTSNSKKENA